SPSAGPRRRSSGSRSRRSRRARSRTTAPRASTSRSSSRSPSSTPSRAAGSSSLVQESEVYSFDVAHRGQILDAYREAVLLEHRPAVVAVELREDGVEVDGALTEGAEALRDRIDVLQVQVLDPAAAHPRDLDGIAAAGDGVAAVVTDADVGVL